MFMINYFLIIKLLNIGIILSFIWTQIIYLYILKMIIFFWEYTTGRKNCTIERGNRTSRRIIIKIAHFSVVENVRRKSIRNINNRMVMLQLRFVFIFNTKIQLCKHFIWKSSKYITVGYQMYEVIPVVA